MTHDQAEALSDDPVYPGNTDDASAKDVLAAILYCARLWVPEARIIGNIRAGDIVRALTSPAPAGGEGIDWVISTLKKRAERHAKLEESGVGCGCTDDEAHLDREAAKALEAMAEALDAWINAYPEQDEDNSIEQLWGRYGSEFAYAMRKTREAIAARCKPAAVTPPPSPDVAGVVERLRDWQDYLPMREFCPGAMPDLLEAANLLESLSAEKERLEAERSELQEALKPINFGGEMFDVLYSEMPDTAQGSITIPLGELRRIRKFVRALTPKEKA